MCFFSVFDLTTEEKIFSKMSSEKKNLLLLLLDLIKQFTMKLEQEIIGSQIVGIFSWRGAPLFSRVLMV
jgi:hypothetical protein